MSVRFCVIDMKRGSTTLLPLLGLGLMAAASASANAAEKIDLSKLPPAANVQVDFERDIRPIFENSCFRCHGPERPKSGFRLDQREPALKGGENGVDIIPGKSAESPLIHAVSYLDEDMQMPPPGKAPRLTDEQVGLLRAWIDQGAPYPAGPTKPIIKFSVTTGVRYISVSGDEGKFREHAWTREGWAGGLERLYLQDRTTNGVIVTAEARAIFDQNDYLMKLRMEKPDVGFVQFGFEQYRRYTDDTGIWFPGYNFPAPSLGEDFALDVGRAWVDLGLTLPHWPRMTLGYEHQYREGDKSSLQYDFLSPDIATDPGGKALLPTRRRLDEQVHIIKFDLDHEIGGVRFSDNFRGEFYNQTSTRDRNSFFVAGSLSGDNGARERDRIDHFQAANALTAEKQVKKWLFLSAGYLYSRLDGGAEFDRTVFVPVNPAFPSFLNEQSNGILINQETHALSGASIWGPWDGLSIVAAIQNEWLRQESLGASKIRAIFADPGDPANFYTSLSRATFNEDLGLKYTKIPMTVVHADARWQQEDTGHYESYFIDDGVADHDDFLRDTDARARLQEYRGGFTISPWTQAAFTGDYKHRDKFTSYDDITDTSGEAGNGYPAFISRREIVTDSVEVKAVLRPASWVRTTLKYERVATDYHTTTDPIAGGGPQSGGHIRAGNYDANVYSISAMLTPWQRLNFSGTFSYTQARLITGDYDNVLDAPYDGDIYSVLSSATFVLTAKTDLNTTYFFSRADYDQTQTGVALPVGLAYNRHGLLSGLTYRWSPNISTKLQYGFFKYSEGSTAHAADYTAHAVFASLTWSMN
jgi:mono/diheme cytochrome c family protein